jgi:hypothetical protein
VVGEYQNCDPSGFGNTCLSGVDTCDPTLDVCVPVSGGSGGSGSKSSGSPAAAPTQPTPTQPITPTQPTPTQPTTPGITTGGTTLLNPLSAGTNLPTLLQDILGFVVKIGAVVVVLMLVYVGFLFATAGGNEGQISKAREALLWTIVGALILLGAQAIASGIQATAQALSSGS